MTFHPITKTDHNQNGPLPKRTTLKRTTRKKYVLQEYLVFLLFLKYFNKLKLLI
jgi:hypothetical protein